MPYKKPIITKINFLLMGVGDSSLIPSELLWGGVPSRRLPIGRSDRSSATLLAPTYPTGDNLRSVF